MADLSFQNIVDLFIGVNIGVAGWGDSFNTQANDIYGQLYWGLLGRKINIEASTTEKVLLQVPPSVKIYMTHMMVYRRGVTATGRTIAIGNTADKFAWHPGFITADLLSNDRPLHVWPGQNQLYGVTPTTEVLYGAGDAVLMELIAGSPVLLDFWMYGIIYKPQS